MALLCASGVKGCVEGWGVREGGEVTGLRGRRKVLGAVARPGGGGVSGARVHSFEVCCVRNGVVNP